MYEDVILKKQREEYKANRRTWKELATEQVDKDLVQLENQVEIYSYSDKQYILIDLCKPLDKLPALPKECLGRKINEVFRFRGELYKINRIIKIKR